MRVAAHIMDGQSRVAAALASVGGGGGSGSVAPGVMTAVRQNADMSWPNPARTPNGGPRLYVGATLPSAAAGAVVRDLAAINGVLWEHTTINVWTNLTTGATQTVSTGGGGAQTGDTNPPSAVVVPFAQLGAEGTWTTTGNVSIVTALADASSASTANGVPQVGGGSVSLTLDMRNFAHIIGNTIAVTLEGVASGTAGEVAIALYGGGVLLGTKTVPLAAGQLSAAWVAAELPARSSWADIEVKVTRAGGNLTLAGVTVQSLAPASVVIPPTVVLDASMAKASNGSAWYQRVNYGALVTDSTARAAALAQSVNSLRLGAYTGTPVWIASSATPRLSVALTDVGRGAPTLMRNSGGTGVLDAVPIPAAAVQSDNAAGIFAVWAADSSQLWELVGASRSAQGAWAAQWGGRIDALPSSAGVHTGTLGFTGSGLSQVLSSVKIAEVAEGLRTGRFDTIRHTVGITIPETSAAGFSWPATRTSGTSSNALALRQGQRLRLPASFDVASSGLTPVGKMIAWAAQNYGLIVVGQDTTATVLAESGEPQRVATGVNPWDALLTGTTAQSVLTGFPISTLEVLALNFGQDGQLGTPTGGAGAKATELMGTPRSGLTWHSGAWTGAPHSVARAEGFGTWRARPSDAALMYVSDATEAAMLTSDFNVAVYNGFGGRLLYTVPLVPKNAGFTLADVASGAKDAIWTKVAQDLVTNGRGNAVVRVGWDVNGGTAAHQGTAANATTWKNAYRKVVAAMRAVSANFRFMFAGTGGRGVSGSADRLGLFTLLYPGDDVVDIVGLEVWDKTPTNATNDTEWSANVLAPSAGPGLTDLVTFARAHGKGAGVPEWGLGATDNAYYITKMYQWFVANNDVVTVESYFSEAGAPFATSLYDPNLKPLAATAYRSAWSAGVVDPPPPAPNPEPVGGVMAWPANAVEVYKKMFASDGPNIASISGDFNVIILSFANQSSGRLRLCGYGAEGKTSLVAALKAKRAAGVRIVLGIGGGGYPINVSDVAGFVADVKWIIDDLGVQLDGLDWDIEHNSDPQNIGLISKALFDHYGPNFRSAVTIGGISNDYDKQNRIQQGLQIQLRGCLSRFAMQCYDWDGWGSPGWYSILKGEYQRYLNDGIALDALGIGMMVGPGATYWTLEKCHQGMTQLKAELGVHKAALWEAARDGTTAWGADMKSILGA